MRTLATPKRIGSANSIRRRSTIKQLANLFNENNNDDDTTPIDESSLSACGNHRLLLLSLLSLLFAASSCYGCFCGFPQLANAETTDQPYYRQHNTVVVPEQQQQHSTSTITSARGSAISHENSLLVGAATATYSSQGSGGLPFLPPFQTAPGGGAVPQLTDPKFDDREARNRAYDQALDQDQRDRDAYYAKMALKARKQRMIEFKARRAELGLDVDDAGPRFGDEKVADMASLKKFLRQQQDEQEPPQQHKQQQPPLQNDKLSIPTTNAE